MEEAETPDVHRQASHLSAEAISRTRSTTHLIRANVSGRVSDTFTEKSIFAGYQGSSKQDVIAVPPVASARILDLVEKTLRALFLSSWLLMVLMLVLTIYPAVSLPAQLVGALWSYIAVLGCFQLFLYVLCVPIAACDEAHAMNAFGHRYVVFGPMNWYKPNRSGLTHARHVRVKTSDGESLGAWHVLPGGQSAREAAAKVASGASLDKVYDESLRQATGLSGARAVLYLHGMGESRCKWVVVEHLKFISTLLGMHCLAIDYRGFADSTGSPTEAGLCIDASSAVQWLCEHGGLRPDEIVCWAHSLGTGVAVRLAHAQQSIGQPLRAIVLEAAYLSLRLAGMLHPAALPFRALPGGRTFVWRYMRGGDELNTKMRIGDLELPILLLHGTDDIMVPCQHGRTLDALLRERLRSTALSPDEMPPARSIYAPHFFVPLPRGGHLDSIFHELTLPAVVDFLRSAEEVVARNGGASERGASEPPPSPISLRHRRPDLADPFAESARAADTGLAQSAAQGSAQMDPLVELTAMPPQQDRRGIQASCTASEANTHLAFERV